MLEKHTDAFPIIKEFFEAGEVTVYSLTDGWLKYRNTGALLPIQEFCLKNQISFHSEQILAQHRRFF